MQSSNCTIEKAVMPDPHGTSLFGDCVNWIGCCNSSIRGGFCVPRLTAVAGFYIPANFFLWKKPPHLVRKKPRLLCAVATGQNRLCMNCRCWSRAVKTCLMASAPIVMPSIANNMASNLPPQSIVGWKTNVLVCLKLSSTMPSSMARPVPYSISSLSLPDEERPSRN